MRTLVIYASMYGNTEKIAKSIAKAVGGKAVQFGEVNNDNLNDFDLVIFGSPTQAGRPLKEFGSFLDQLPQLKDIKAAAFDTRFDENKQNFGLRLLMKIIGYAGPKIIKKLEQKGMATIGCEGFYVTDTEGPLAKDELQKASEWARGLLPR